MTLNMRTELFIKTTDSKVVDAFKLVVEGKYSFPTRQFPEGTLHRAPDLVRRRVDGTLYVIQADSEAVAERLTAAGYVANVDAEGVLQVTPPAKLAA